jgi:hypothetical protein
MYTKEFLMHSDERALSHTQQMLATSLAAAVPLRIWELAQQGGPKPEEIERIRAQWQEDILGPKGPDLFFRSWQAGETAERFNLLAQAIAVLSFQPRGVHVFGQHFDAQVFLSAQTEKQQDSPDEH